MNPHRYSHRILSKGVKTHIGEKPLPQINGAGGNWTNGLKRNTDSSQNGRKSSPVTLQMRG